MVGDNTITAFWKINPKTNRMLQAGPTKAIKSIAQAKVSYSENIITFAFIVIALFLIL